MEFNKETQEHKRVRAEFYYGSVEDNLEEQANKQGLTLGNKAELFEELKNAWLLLRDNKALTEKQADIVSQKIHDQLLHSLKLIGNENLKVTIQKNLIELNKKERIFEGPKYLSFSRDEVQNESKDNK